MFLPTHPEDTARGSHLCARKRAPTPDPTQAGTLISDFRPQHLLFQPDSLQCFCHSCLSRLRQVPQPWQPEWLVASGRS